MTGVLTLIIGLDRNYRGVALEAQLGASGLAYRRVQGVEGTYQGQPTAAYTDARSAELLYGRPLSPGEIGCALAHRDCYLQLLASDAEWALVFEDDALIVRADALREAVSRIGELPHVSSPSVLMLYGRKMASDVGRQLEVSGSQIVKLAQTPTTTTAYFINRSAASQILQYGLPLRNPADWPVGVEGRLEFFGVYPWVAVPDEVRDSSIGTRTGGKREGWIRVRHRFAAVSFVKWIANRRHYRDFSEYWSWEVRRPLVGLAIDRRVPYRVPSEAKSIPSAGSFAVMLGRLLGAKRSFALIDELKRHRGSRESIRHEN